MSVNLKKNIAGDTVARKRLDCVEEAERFIAQRSFPGPPAANWHANLLSFLPHDPKYVIEVSDEELELVRQRILLYHATTAASPEIYREEEAAFNEKIWPVLYASMKKNPTQVQLMLRDGSHSRYLDTFIVDIAQGNLAVAVLAGHFVGHSVLDTLEVIPPTDGAFYYCEYEKSFTFVRFRAQEVQKAFGGAKKVLLLGVGVDPALWVRGFRPAADQHFVMYDQLDASKYWAQVLGMTPAEFGLDYRVANFAQAFADPSQAEAYDCVVLSGVASYYADPEKLGQLLGGAARLLRPGGRLMFDLQVAHEVYRFDVLGMGWPTGMTLEPSAQAAIDKAVKVLGSVGLMFVDSVLEADPAGVVFWAMKPS